MDKIYLDNNATTALSPKALTAMLEELSGPASNPSSVHSFGQKARQKLLRAHETIADFLGCRPQEVIFTSGGTEAMNTLIRSIANTLPKGQIITSTIEHSCVDLMLADLKTAGWEIVALPPGEKGFISLEQIENSISPATRFIVLAAVNNETGVKCPVEAIGEFAQKKGIPFLVDGIAWIGKELFRLPVGISGIGFSSHKFHGPKGVGFAIVRSPMRFFPLLVGGSQQNGKRAGTENLAGILGTVAAIEEIPLVLPEASKRMLALRTTLEEGLSLSGALINGNGERICNTVNMSFPGVDGENLLIQLDQAGIAVSHGSACSAGAMELSRVLLNMGFLHERVRSSLRFSLSRMTTPEEINRCIEVTTRLVHLPALSISTGNVG